MGVFAIFLSKKISDIWSDVIINFVSDLLWKLCEIVLIG